MSNLTKLVLGLAIAILLAGVLYGMTGQKLNETVASSNQTATVTNIEKPAETPATPAPVAATAPAAAPVPVAAKTESSFGTTTVGAVEYKVNDKGEPILEDHILGKADAKVTIIEYASLTCPHCAHFHNEVYPQLKAKYIDTGIAKLIWRPFPFDQVAVKATMVAYCVPPSQFYPLIEVLYKDQDNWARADHYEDELKKMARLAGLGEDKINSCLKSDKLSAAVLRGRLEAEKNPGVASTPTFLIGSEKIEGARPIEVFDRVIAAQLNPPPKAQ
jgi:protein-disulfide isomerase